MNASQAMNAYRKVSSSSAVESASPHQLIGLLYQGAIDRVSAAKGAMGRGDIAEQGEMTGKAISIIENLRVALDHEQGGEVAENLSELYAYMERRLLEARTDGDTAKLDEVIGLMHEIKSGWDGIPAEYR
jgi:flagellar protein FliS